ncbi:glycoside hydrolase family 10 protein [Nocardiopsis sediminis]|uniref:Glycoside hydrolase family 10 protein n=1 Tax=Nocardiopsis sediminis TaxID=1778267 RepID=A0ABV8FP38_9ACTN
MPAPGAPRRRIPRTAAPRRPLLRILSGAVAALVTGSLVAAAPANAAQPASPGTTAAQPCPPATGHVDDRQMRAMWISSVTNIDWPSTRGLDPAAQQQELTDYYDEAVSNGLNAVFVQIRPTADAFWPSPHEPWSEWLTGTQGRDPGYDPLAFAVREAHARGLEFHGWFNPYRVAMHDDPTRLTADHPARVNPDWVFSYNGRLYYDPGVPEVRTFVQDAIMDAVENYDLDGVHFDDYFYPYPADGQAVPDGATFDRYGGSFDDIGAWRRDNVNRLIEEIDGRIHAAKPDVEFGISPFGIWRNAATDPAGSDTNGFQSYDGIFADSRRWVTEGWVNYINPQVYWEIGHPAADYAVLVPWWNDVVEGTGVDLYIGQAAYKVGEQPGWEDPRELSDHLTLNRDYPNVGGDVFFSAVRLRTNAAEAMRIVVEEHYSQPATAPAPVAGTWPAGTEAGPRPDTPGCGR